MNDTFTKCVTSLIALFCITYLIATGQKFIDGFLCCAITGYTISLWHGFKWSDIESTSSIEDAEMLSVYEPNPGM